MAQSFCARWRRNGLGQKAGLVGWNEIHAETGTLALTRCHGVLFDAHRAGNVDHDTRLSRSKKTVAESADQTLAFLSFRRRQMETHVGHVDHDSMGIGQREHLVRHGAGECDREAGQLLVATNLAASCRYSALCHLHGPVGGRCARLRLIGGFDGGFPDFGLRRLALGGRCFADLRRLREGAQRNHEAGQTSRPTRQAAHPSLAGRCHRTPISPSPRPSPCKLNRMFVDSKAISRQGCEAWPSIPENFLASDRVRAYINCRKPPHPLLAVPI